MSNNERIVFKHSPDGEIYLNYTLPALANVFEIGAIALTYKRTFYDPNTPIYEYATDRGGLEKIINKSEDLLDHLHMSLSALGVVLANAQKEGVDDQLNNLGWLINSLSELAYVVNEVTSNMNTSLKTKKPD